MITALSLMRTCLTRTDCCACTTSQWLTKSSSLNLIDSTSCLADRVHRWLTTSYPNEVSGALLGWFFEFFFFLDSLCIWDLNGDSSPIGIFPVFNHWARAALVIIIKKKKSTSHSWHRSPTAHRADSTDKVMIEVRWQQRAAIARLPQPHP